MSSWGDKVETAVHPGVRDPLLPGDIDLLFKELLILFVDVLGNGLPAVDIAREVNLRGKEHFNKKDKEKKKSIAAFLNLMYNFTQMQRG